VSRKGERKFGQDWRRGGVRTWFGKCLELITCLVRHSKDSWSNFNGLKSLIDWIFEIEKLGFLNNLGKIKIYYNCHGE
jgi:hypothetical protein